MQKRVLNHQETYEIPEDDIRFNPVGLNTFPVTSAISMKEVHTNKTFTILTS